MPLKAATDLGSFRLAAGEAFVIQMQVDEGEDADQRAFVMSVFGPEREIIDTINGVQNEDLFEFIRPGTWSEGLYDKPGLKIEIAERLKDGRAVIATPSLTIDASAATVADYTNSVIARTAVAITARYSQRGVVAASADTVRYDPGSSSTPSPGPQLTLTGPLTFSASAPSGTEVASIGTVPAGVTPTLTPGDGRLVIAGSAGAWKVVTGLSASSAGSIALTVLATGATSASATVTVTAAVLPKLANLKIDFNPSSMAQQADGTAFTRTLTDTVSGIQAVQPTAANQPIWVANAAGGKPGIRNVSGSQWLNVNAPGIYKTIIDTKIYTLIDLVIDTQANGLGCVGGGSTGGNNFFPVCDGTYVGSFHGGSIRTQVPYAATAFSAIGYTSTSANKGGSATSGLTRTYVNGMCKSAHEASPQTDSNTTNFALLARSSAGEFGAKTTLIRRLVFDVDLSPAECLQWVLAKFAEYGVAHPLAAVNEVKVFDGDSLTNSLGAPVDKSLGYLVAQTNNYPMGTWCNVAIGGLTSQNCIDKAAAEVDGVITASGKRGIVFFQERANDQPGVSPAQGGALHTTYISARKAANSTAKVIGQTPADWVSGYASVSPDAWNTYLIANSVSIGYSSLARVDLNATIGGNSGAWNTYPESGPYTTPFSDGVHFQTYAIQAALVAPLMAAA